MAMQQPPSTSKGAASFAIVQTNLQARAINSIVERHGASAARVIVERSRWHKVTERELEVQLYFTERAGGWDEHHFFYVRPSGAWRDGGDPQGVWRNP